MNNWRLTDNRHWDSPARMSDGRSFTNYTSSAIVASEIQDRIGLNKGTQVYRDFLQANANKLIAEERVNTYTQLYTQNPWAQSYSPPITGSVISTNARNGSEVTDITGGHGVQTTPIIERMTQPGMRVPHSKPNIVELDDPRWGISPATLVLTKRHASPQGGNVWGWLNSDSRV